MSMNVGLNLVEVDGKATPALQAAATSVAAFVVRSARGIGGEVRQVTSFSDFVQYFGSYINGGFGAYVVRGFFDNGGVMAHITRVVGSAAVATTHDVPGTASGNSAPTTMTLTAGFMGKSDPGAWGNALSYAIVTDPDDATLFTLIIRLDKTIVETWPKLKVDGTGAQNPTSLNDPFSGSGYVTVTLPATLAGNPAPTGVDSKGDLNWVSFGTNGADDGLTGSTLEQAYSAALSLFDTKDVQLVAIPETSDPGTVQSALTYCRKRGDCMFVGHVPDNMKAGDAKTWVRTHNLQGDKVYGALYFPFIRVADPIGNQKYIPPTGHILGVYARTDRERGVWKAPAGNAAKLNNALDLRFEITDVQHTDLVKNGSVNAVRAIPGQGIVIDSSRTLSTSTLWLYVNVRLLFNFVESSLKSGLRWTVQEPNDPTLWNKVKYNSVVPFLMGLWRRGAFGPGKPSDVFTVKIDAENNPPENIQQGLLNIEVYFYPSRPAETIVITVGQQEGGATAAEG